LDTVGRSAAICAYRRPVRGPLFSWERRIVGGYPNSADHRFYPILLEPVELKLLHSTSWGRRWALFSMYLRAEAQNTTLTCPTRLERAGRYGYFRTTGGTM